MTQMNYKVPDTNLMRWYKEQEDKMNVVRAIRSKIENHPSSTLITNWMLGYSEAKRNEQLKVLEEITGISRSDLFKFVEESNE